MAESIYWMKEGGLDYSMYYHIKDAHFRPEVFYPFYPAPLVIKEELFWNYRSQQLGLFDLQSRPRPAYFLFKLLSRLTGDRVRLTSDNQTLHGLATHDERLGAYNLLFWNFSDSPVQVELELVNAPRKMSAMRQRLNATGGSDDDTYRIQTIGYTDIVTGGSQRLDVDLGPYDVQYWLMR
jgi:hypothetical protein